MLSMCTFLHGTPLWLKTHCEAKITRSAAAWFDSSDYQHIGNYNRRISRTRINLFTVKYVVNNPSAAVHTISCVIAEGANQEPLASTVPSEGRYAVMAPWDLSLRNELPSCRVSRVKEPLKTWGPMSQISCFVVGY